MILIGSTFAAQAIGLSSARAFDDFFSDDFFGEGRRSDGITMGLGNSVAHNIAVQTIDPWPHYVGKSRIDIDGERLLGHAQQDKPVSGIRGYKTNSSIPPQGLSTRANSGGEGSGGGGNNDD
jgi:hypothetical protein